MRRVALGLTLSFLIAPLASAQLARASSPGGASSNRSPVPEGNLIYDQFDSPTGAGLSDQDFEAASEANSNEGADDFVVPWGEIASIFQVQTVGSQTNGGVPASVDVWFYRDEGGTPAAFATCEYLAIAAGADPANLTLDLPTPCVLPGGVWWLAIQVNEDFLPGTKQHFWSTRTVQTGYQAHWRNPGGGWGHGCTDWGTLNDCGYSVAHQDFLFRVWGFLVDDLYDQTDDPADNGIIDQDFEAGLEALTSEAADDFVVPWSEGWNVQRVQTVGVEGFGGPPQSVDVWFYADASGVPASVPECEFLNLPTASPVSLDVVLPGGCSLGAGKWWVSVQVNLDSGDGNHYWTSRATQTGSPAVWRNPLDGYATGCTDWGAISTCVPADPFPDLVFRLQGAPMLIFEDSFEIGSSGRWSS